MPADAGIAMDRPMAGMSRSLQMPMAMTNHTTAADMVGMLGGDGGSTRYPSGQGLLTL